MGRQASCLHPASGDDGMANEAMPVVQVQRQREVLMTAAEEIEGDPRSRGRVVDPPGDVAQVLGGSLQDGPAPGRAGLSRPTFGGSCRVGRSWDRLRSLWSIPFERGNGRFGVYLCDDCGSTVGVQVTVPRHLVHVAGPNNRSRFRSAGTLAEMPDLSDASDPPGRLCADVRQPQTCAATRTLVDRVKIATTTAALRATPPRPRTTEVLCSPLDLDQFREASPPAL